MSNLTEDCEKLDPFFPEGLKDHWFHSRYFYPNFCHLCSPRKISDHDQLIIRCDKCNMISYCGELHKKQHEKEHQDLCRVIQSLLESSGSTNLFDFMKKMIEDPDKRLKKKYSLISTVEERLNRKLYNNEKQMFLHPRVCFCCLESDPAKLVNCPSCPHVCFCNEHDHEEAGHTKYNCLMYNYCFVLDWRFMLDDKYDIFVNTENFPFLFLNPEAFRPPETMGEFFECIEEETLLKNALNYAYWRRICSKLYSNSLTLRHLIKELELDVQSGLIIHIIGIQNSTRKDLAIHEVLLHLSSSLKNLKIVAVGKELEQDDKRIARHIGICKKCVEENKTLIVESIKMPYASYVESKYFTTPHFIITYNVGETEVHMWDESLTKIMNKIRVPFVMTTSTKLRAKTENKKIMERFGHLIKKPYFGINPFPSGRPYRDAQEDNIKFENDMILYYILHQVTTNEQLPSGDSQNSPKSDVNIEQSLERNRGNKKAGKKKFKKKNVKKAKQASSPAGKKSSLDKEEKLKDTEKKDAPETLDSQSNPTEISKELLDQESDKKKEDDLVNKGESGAKVSSSDKGTEGTSEKSSIEEQRSNSENEKKEAKPNIESYPEKSEYSSAGDNSSLIASIVDESSSSSEQNVSKNKETLKDQLVEGNTSQTKTSSDSSKHSEASAEASEGKEKPNDESTDAKKSETFIAVADVEEKCEKKIQEQKDESNKSSEEENKSKNSESSSIQSQAPQILQKVHSSKQHEASEDKEETKVEATDATKAQTSKSDPNFQREKSENKVQEQTDGSAESSKEENKESKTDESSEHSVEKHELDSSLKERKRKFLQLKEENDQLLMLINKLTREFEQLKENSGTMAHDLLEESLALKDCSHDSLKKLSKVFKTDDSDDD